MFNYFDGNSFEIKSNKDDLNLQDRIQRFWYGMNIKLAENIKPPQ